MFVSFTISWCFQVLNITAKQGLKMKTWYEELAGLWNMLQKKSESKYKNTIYHKLWEKSWHRISRKLNKSPTRLLAPLTLEILSGAKPCSEAAWSHTFPGNRVTKMCVLGFFFAFPYYHYLGHEWCGLFSFPTVTGPYFIKQSLRRFPISSVEHPGAISIDLWSLALLWLLVFNQDPCS